MRNRILIGFIALITASTIADPPKAEAQSAPQVFTKQAPDTCINQDTVIVYFNEIPSNIQKLRARVNRVSGAIAANSYVILQSNVEGLEWDNAKNVNGDSMTVANQATTYKDWPIESTNCTSYRIFYITPSSSQRSVLRFTYLRRPDEN